MSRKLNLLVALALAAILCLSSVTTVFATEPPAKGKPGTGVNDQAQAAVTKILKVPVGTVIPAMNFVFNVTALTVGGVTGPSVGPITVSLGAGATGTVDATHSDTINIIKEQNVFAGVTWPGAGVYEYEIVENAGASYQSTNAAQETLSYSPGKYRIKVYVKDDGQGPYVCAFGVLVVEKDNDGQNAGEKVDPTPGGNNTTYLHSQMVFTNTYVKTNRPTDPDKPDPAQSPLYVSKAVTGAYGVLTDVFNFTLTVTAPSLVPNNPAPVYTARVMENGTVVKTISFTSGVSNTFELKHDQKLVFIDTPVGTSYTVTEVNPTYYIPTVVVIKGGTTVATIGGNQTDLSQSISTGSQLIGETNNHADYTNKREDVAPTGLNLNDLPFIGMIILAAGAIAGYIVLKTRKAKKVQAK